MAVAVVELFEPCRFCDPVALGAWETPALPFDYMHGVVRVNLLANAHTAFLDVEGNAEVEVHGRDMGGLFVVHAMLPVRFCPMCGREL